MGFETIIIYVVFIAVLWFFMMRPQKKEQKRVQLMLAEMQVGDTVLTLIALFFVLSFVDAS